MTKLSKFRNSINAGLSTILITLGMVSKDQIRVFLSGHVFKFSDNYIYFFIAFIGIIIAKIGGDPIINTLFKIRKVRKLILGRAFVEGYWLYSHYAGSAARRINSESIFYGNSLAELQYDNETGKLTMNVYRLEPTVGLFNSSSNMITFDDRDFTYLSYFTYNSIHAQELDGFARGRYTGTPEKGLHSYDGMIMIYANNGKPMAIRQKGHKIDISVINKFKKDFPEDNLTWREKLLRTIPEPA